MNYSNNPQSVYNGMMSGQRNMFLSSSVAVAIIGFSNTFKDKNMMWITKLIGVCIFILSIVIGIHVAQDFSFYLQSMKDDIPKHIPYDNWSKWPYISYVYSIFLVVIATLFFFRKLI